ncbi:MAG TPA: ATP-dependent DNA helicase RecG [Solirubrobacteraceae bacterium]|nr:ATP-dependent DNA helicase RecG [Solirubrobacteraceae bacterium]
MAQTATTASLTGSETKEFGPDVAGRRWRAPRFASSKRPTWEELLAAPVRWPQPSRLRRPLEVQAGGKLAEGLGKLGLTSVGDLLEHLPREGREASTIGGLREEEPATIAVQVRSIAARPVRRRGMKPLVQAKVFDRTGTIGATFFNQPWLVQRYKPGTRLVLHGKLTARGTFNVSHHAPGQDLPIERGPAPAPEAAGEVAHYPASEGVSSTQIFALVQAAWAGLADVPEALDAKTRLCEKLPDRASALAAMHGARDAEERERGRQRLAYEELLLTQLSFLRRRSGRREQGGAIKLDRQASLSARWLEQLPFALTEDQRMAIQEIGEDLGREQAMQRLLLGEVGSGKTVVALWAMLRAVEHGHQSALMAPTETLAEQHFATLQRLLGGEQANVTCALLTGSTPARRRADTLGKLASGELSLIVGTHALIEPDVQFAGLAVAIVDEQHRFGVRQRAAFERSGWPAGSAGGPAEAAGGLAEAAGGLAEAAGGLAEAAVAHVLHMTATPIPRTLALVRYGDLDTTMLRELPAGRQAIETRIVAGEEARARAYEHLREQLRAGRQAYVVCPLISDGDDGPAASAESEAAGGEGLRAATAELERLQAGELKDHRLVLLHGGMRPAEKANAMAQFAAGSADVLIATTVIEVGIDVANATVILIENAERFGISQLHQLRGRVGRGEHRSSCLLGTANAGSPRLQALAEHSDGFELAEIDLKLRNEGELIGVRQSGLSQHRVARLPEDLALLERARERALSIVTADPGLRAPEHALLEDALQRAFGAQVVQPIPG